ncbi:hypothetical protein [Amycolatopsis sp. BJA-103]|uniref:hypothetical protein n=1 Tax=unclassified Amycolatopsis TaxID=2618356 RepID=UPI0011AF6E9E|nr:hypothetical protein [Amycolatopsis sp. BJA-103]
MKNAFRGTVTSLAATLLLLGSSVTASATVEDVPPEGSDYYIWNCTYLEFCYFKHYGARHENGGWGRGFLENGFYNIGADGYGDQTSSIWNRSGVQVWGYDWHQSNQCWKEIWVSPNGNWGDLDPKVDNLTDAISVGGKVNGDIC